ncbi:MAG: ParB/RepB/Spo0J family partition protein [Sphaerochaetaceae bacterium]
MSNSSKKRGLGRGISSLMDDYSFNGVFVEEVDGEKYLSLPINKVRPNPHQPRKKFDQETLDELAESIKTQGILQPLLVEKISDDDYAIIAGERRYRAALQLGMEKVPAIVKKFSDFQRLEVSLIENIQRENLNPIEEARAYLFLLEQSDLKQEELAERVGKKRSTISNSIRLLQLPKEMQQALLEGKFSAGHARALLSLVNPSDREYLYQKLIEEELSVREAEKLALDLQQGKGRAKEKRATEVKERPIDLLVLEQRFLEACGTKVKIKGTLQKGRVEISYHSMDDLDRLYRLLAQEESIEL